MRSRRHLARAKRELRIAAVGSLLLASLAFPRVGCADYRVLYIEGLRSFQFEKWQEALMLFDAASQENTSEGEWIRPYGMRYEAYLPHYYIGACLYRLGKYEKALASWQESERQGAILERKNRYWHKQLEALRRELVVDLPASARNLQQEASLARKRLQELQVPTRVGGADSEIESVLRRVDTVLADLEDELQGVSTAAVVESSQLRLSRVWEDLSSAALTIRRLEKEAAVAERERLEAERQRSIEADRQKARQLLAEGACVPGAIELLEKVQGQIVQTRAASPASAGFYLQLARAHLQCVDLHLAEHYFDLARRRDALPGEVEVFRQQLAEATERRRVAVRLQEATALIARGQCSRRAIAVLESLVEERSVPADDASVPFLVLSDGYMACGDVRRASDYLERARDRGVASDDLLAARRQAIDEERRALTAAEARQARITLIEQASQAISAGGCQREAIDSLEDLLREQPSMEDPRQGDGSSLQQSRLVYGYLNCGEPEAAAGALRSPRMESASPETMASLGAEIERLRQEQARRLREEQALSGYLKGLARVRLGECSDDVMSLIESAQAVLGSSWNRPAVQEGESAKEDYAPFLALAQAQRNCRNLEETRAFLRLSRNNERAPHDEVEELETWLRQAGVYAESHALLIAAYDYEEGWEPLSGPKEDIKAIKGVLARHDFEIQEIENPTSAELREEIRRFINKHGQAPENRLLFYYAGHGWTASRFGLKLGYLVPVDATLPENDSNYLTRLVSMDNFRVYAQEIAARHAIFMFDSCFSGKIFDATRSTVESELASTQVEDLIGRPVRLFITAGDENQLVPDFSIFRKTIVEALEGKADTDSDGLVLGSEIGHFVRSEVQARARTTPQWGKMSLGELGLGDMVFKNVHATNKRLRRREPRGSFLRGGVLDVPRDQRGPRSLQSLPANVPLGALRGSREVDAGSSGGTRCRGPLRRAPPRIESR